jgi:uncharacterized short protein YbdD (DUF466 family)
MIKNKTMNIADYGAFLAYMRKKHPKVLDKIKKS